MQQIQTPSEFFALENATINGEKKMLTIAQNVTNKDLEVVLVVANIILEFEKVMTRRSFAPKIVLINTIQKLMKKER